MTSWVTRWLTRRCASPAFAGVVYWDDPYARVPVRCSQGLPTTARHLLQLGLVRAMELDVESFTVYEHPHSIVIQKRRKALPRRSSRAYGPHLRGHSAETLDRLVGGEMGLVYTEEQKLTQRNGESWNAIYFLRDLPNEYAWLVWLLAVQLISLAAWPLTYVIFRPLHDRGYLFAKPIGILIVATIAWLLASYGIIGFSAFSVGVGIVALAIVSFIIFWKLGDEILIFTKAHWRTIAIAELIFLLAFLAFLAIRLANPDLWHAWRGGEKPMDFAYLNAITRSTIMPPYDPWFAGGYLNYYYYGQYLIATLIRITGLQPAVAYNLAVPLVFSLSFTTIYALAYNLIALAIRSRYTSGKSDLRVAPIIFGVIAAMLALVAANIDGLVQLARRNLRIDHSRAGVPRFRLLAEHASFLP